MKDLWNKIIRKWMKLRLQPISVFCFHQVSDEYNPMTMWDCDWTQTDKFKCYVNELQKHGYHFISLQAAHKKLKHDWVRCKKYAVLTADDGYKSMFNILPWLEEQHIPITLFINSKYLDGKSWSAINEEQSRRVKPNVDMVTEVCPDLYMSKDELLALTSPFITIGMHGHEHIDATKQTTIEFKNNVELCYKSLRNHPRYIPFFAYTWGRHNEVTDRVLKDMSIVPVFVSGRNNYKHQGFIDRLAIDGKQL